MYGKILANTHIFLNFIIYVVQLSISYNVGLRSKIPGQTCLHACLHQQVECHDHERHAHV